MTSEILHLNHAILRRWKKDLPDVAKIGAQVVRLANDILAVTICRDGRLIADKENRMSNVFCGATDCKYNEDEYCTKNEISLYLIDVLYKGRDDFEPKEETIELEQE